MSSPATSPTADHKFLIVVPVADRPRMMQNCLDSLLALCRSHGRSEVSALIADDSRDAAHVAGNRALAETFTRRGLPVAHFGPDEQFDLLASLPESLARIVGRPTRAGHKGQGVMRNLAYLKLARQGLPEDTLVWSVDSDQEFRVPLPDGTVFAPDYFGRLDEIFSSTDALVLTGKVVGDPPVSPAVMAGNFLDDVIAFLEQAGDGRAPCRHHGPAAQRDADAAYHDMADLFGFTPAAEAWRYPCPLTGAHTNADCLDRFAGRLAGFFHGEHPTRVSRYQPGEDAPRPARTVYAGNYVFRPEALKWFIPFAALRLRMSGPTLGRILRAEIGGRFVSANLPMLHRRTVDAETQSEFRPGVSGRAAAIDISDEFERQFYGDVMLFSVERGALRDPAVLDEVRDDMRARYGARQAGISDKLDRLDVLLDVLLGVLEASPAARARLAAFRDNVARNFGAGSPALARIDDPEGWRRWRDRLQDAVRRYPEDRQAWDSTICSPTRA